MACSFVSVTQQFNTTTSMGRLTLKLSFAQFEREVTSERIRDKPGHDEDEATSAIARGRRWFDEIVSGSVIGVEQIAPKMQYASGQYDDFARVPRSKVACRAALELNDCAMLRQNGADNSKRSD